MEEVEHVSSLAQAKRKLDMVGLVADQYQRDPINTVRQFTAQRIYQGIKQAYAAFRYLCPINKRHDDPMYPQANPEFERAVGYVRLLAHAMEDHPDARESLINNAAIYSTAVELMLDSLKRCQRSA